MAEAVPNKLAPPDRSVQSGIAIYSFFFLTFVWTWGLWWIANLLESETPIFSNALFLASAYGPGFAAVTVILAYTGVAGLRKWFGKCLNWRIAWRWYLLAIVVPLLIMFAAIGIQWAFGGPIPTLPDTNHVMLALSQFPLILIFGGPLGEEFGWRGFAMPALSARIGWRWAGVLVGAAWALWHLPLLWMADTVQADLPLTLFFGSTMALAVVMARLSVNTGFSVLPAILLHSVINWSSMLLPIMPKGGDATTYALIMAIAIILALAALLKPGPDVTAKW